MSVDIGIDKYGSGHGRFITWGYLPHEDKYNKPTIDGRNAALIMKSGVYDGKTDTHQARWTRSSPARIRCTPGTTSRAVCIPSTARPCRRSKNTVDMEGQYSWSTAVRHAENGRLEAGAAGATAGRRRQAWRSLAALRSAGPRHVQEAWAAPACMLRHFARMHEVVKLYRQAERALREFRLNDPWYIKPTETGRPRLGRDRGDPRRAVPLDRGSRRQDQELSDHRADHLERRAAVGGRRSRPDGGSADRHADRRSARSGRGRARLPLLRFLPGLHRSRP